MNLQIRFADGTTEERDAASPCIFDVFDPVLKHPSEERWYLWFPDADPPLSFCGRNVLTLDEIRGGKAKVWRITGQDAATKALSGEWQSAYVESREEQIERLTAERDGATSALRHVERLGLRDRLGQRQAVLHAKSFLEGKPLPAVEERLSAALASANALAAECLRGDKTMGKTIWRLQNRLARRKRHEKQWRARCDAARRMVVIRSGGIKSSKEARELDALTNQAIEEGWFKAP